MNNDDKFTPTGIVDTSAKGRGDLNISTLTVREHFAVMAMQGCWYELTDCAQPRHIEYAAKASVEMADALLKALEDNG